MRVLILLLGFVILCYGYICPLTNDNVCCAASCTECGPCVNNTVIDNLCCETNITNNGIICGVFDAPCVRPSSDRLNTSFLLLENTTYINEACCNNTQLEDKHYCHTLEGDYNCTTNFTRIIDYCCNETIPLNKTFCGYVLDMNCSITNLCCDFRKKKKVKNDFCDELPKNFTCPFKPSKAPRVYVFLWKLLTKNYWFMAICIVIVLFLIFLLFCSYVCVGNKKPPQNYI